MRPWQGTRSPHYNLNEYRRRFFLLVPGGDGGVFYGVRNGW